MKRLTLAVSIFVTVLSTSLAPMRGQISFQTLKSFEFPSSSSGQPYDRVMLASDGALYGTTYKGGSNNVGTVFTMNTDGSGYQVLHHMLGADGDGRFPRAAVVEASDGVLYGTTEFGGRNGNGAIYKLNKGGSGYMIVYSFGATATDGQNPYAALLEGRYGSLYGTTHFGGVNGAGTVFKIKKDGTGYAVLRDFGPATFPFYDGEKPWTALIQGTDGMLYGTTERGGSYFSGTVFKLNDDGSDYTKVADFDLRDTGSAPHGALLEGSDGVLYGTTWTGGNLGGTIYKLNKDGSEFAALRKFTSAFIDEQFSEAGLIEASDGVLYGTTSTGGGANKLGCIFKIKKDGSGYGVVRAFNRNGEGTSLYGAVIEGSDGSLYGSSRSGGAANKGTVFKLNKDGSGYKILRDFTYSGTDGYFPYSELREASDGALYGTTYEGGTSDLGTIFKINKDGSGFSVLRHLTNAPGEGWNPYAGVVEASDGVLYGTTYQGGAGSGAIYKLNRDGSGYTLLHGFTFASTDGRSPYGAVVEGRDGILYGTTYQGGSTNRGTIYGINKDGSAFRLLKSFVGGSSDGQNPYGGLIEGSDGFLYGATYSGGTSNRGTIFKIGKDGQNYQLLQSFGGSSADGQSPYAGVFEGRDGFLYGTTLYGGAANYGTIFKIAKSGIEFSTLHSFGTGAGDGYYSYARIVEAADGALYGTTYSGGGSGFGVIFSIRKDGSGYTVVRSFSGQNGEGENPYAGLIQASDGSLYGLTQYGGQSDVGTIFRFTKTSSVALRLAASFSLTSRQPIITLSGPSGAMFDLETTSNFFDWSKIATITNVSGQTPFTDVSASNAPRRFYRATRLQ
jgi:uncharacterized repeat protein (TIGR03803 family)